MGRMAETTFLDAIFNLSKRAFRLTAIALHINEVVTCVVSHWTENVRRTAILNDKLY